MVEQGSSVNINDNSGNTPLHLAVASDNPIILDYLLEQKDIIVNARNFSGATPLLCAVEHRKEHVVKKLLGAGACPNLPNLLEISPLHMAPGKPNIVRLLIESGAKLDAIDYGGETPLHEAVEHNCIETLCMLLYYNADPNIPCHNNITPFMKAIIFENQDIQHVLLDYVDDFNVVAGGGMSTLSLALAHNSPYKRDIIERGADVNYKHRTCNAFEIVCQYSPDDFPLIWKNLDYQKLAPDRDYWDIICAIDIAKKYPFFLDIVAESGNVKPFLGKFEGEFQYIPLLEFLSKMPNCERSLWEQTITKLVFVFLSQGATLTNANMDDVYYAFGYSWLFEMLLYQEIYMNRMVPFLFPSLIYHVNESVRQHLDGNYYDWNVHVLGITKESIRRHLMQYAQYVHSYYICYEDNHWHLEYRPSLLEMARNKTREHLIEKFKLTTSMKFYTFLKRFPIHQVFKDILSFKRPIYQPRENFSFYE